jgi:hypothetical protein
MNKPVTAPIVDRPMVHAPLRFRLRPGGRNATKRAFLLCPKCDAPGWIRHSERITEQVSHLTIHCTDSGCGHVWRSDIVFVHSLVEGNIERPDLGLKVCPREQVTHVRPPGEDDDDEQISLFEPPGTCPPAS